MGPTCHSLTLPSPCAAQCAVWRPRSSRSSHRCALPSWRAIPFFRPSDVAKSLTPPSRARHLPSLLPAPSRLPPKLKNRASGLLYSIQKSGHQIAMDFKSSAPKAHLSFYLPSQLLQHQPQPRQTLESRISPPPEPPWCRREPHVARPPPTIPAATNYTNRAVVIS